MEGSPLTEQVSISIAKQFSEFPGGRFPEDGPFNGTTFRKEYLVPPLKDGKHVVVSLDGVAGFGSSFLEEAFGGLVRVEGFKKKSLAKQLELICNEEDLYDFIEVAIEFIREAEAENS